MRAHSVKTGTLVLVVGPSGAGKDTLLDLAKNQLVDDARFCFVRRVITRPAGGSENSEFATEDGFCRRVKEGGFALHWRAHGISYGLPKSVDEWLAEGKVVIANGSRTALPDALEKYPTLKILKISAPPELVAERLEKRGRESRDMIVARLLRNRDVDISGANVEEIENSGSPAVAAEHLVQSLLASAACMAVSAQAISRE